MIQENLSRFDRSGSANYGSIIIFAAFGIYLDGAFRIGFHKNFDTFKWKVVLRVEEIQPSNQQLLTLAFGPIKTLSYVIREPLLEVQ